MRGGPGDLSSLTTVPSLSSARVITVASFRPIRKAMGWLLPVEW